MTTAETGAPRRPPGPGLRLSIALTIAGALLAVPTLVAGIVPIVRAVTASPRFDVPGEETLHLGKGTYMLYEDRGSASIGSSFSQDDSVTITPSDVTVTGPSGAGVEVFDRGTTIETLTANNRRYVGAVRFTTPVSGDYTIHVASVTSTSVLVARPLTKTLESVIGWFLLAGIGALVVVAGIVMIIVGSVRRSRARNALAYAQAYAAGPPPGWHPDPWGSGRLRYWDGARWTGHLH